MSDKNEVLEKMWPVELPGLLYTAEGEANSTVETMEIYTDQWNQ